MGTLCKLRGGIPVHSTPALLRRFAPYFKKYLGIFFLDLFCAGLTALCEIVLPLLVRYLAQTGMEDLSLLSAGLVLRVGAVYLALRVIDVVAYYFMCNRGHIMGAMIETDMRTDLFEHLQTLSFHYFANTKVGQIMARITSDLFDVTEFAHHCPEEFFVAGLKIAVSFFILCTINIPLTLLIFVMVPLMIVCSSVFNTGMRRTFRENRAQVGEINAQVEDSLLGVRVVKSFTGEAREIEKFGAGNALWLRLKRANYRWMAGFHATTRVFDGLMYLAVILAGGFAMTAEAITPADLMAYVMYVTTLLATIRRIVEFTEQFQRGMTGIERFFEIMDEKPDITEPENAVVLSHARGDIQFENVSFAYADDPAHPILANLTLNIEAGSSVALVGPSGGGKTTICNLIPRFYDVTAGRLTIDGHDVRSLSLGSLRRSIGIVQQDVYLFSGTIFENILYGRPTATREEVIEAAKRAGAHEFILHTPDGYDTYVGERGVKLSGGQKQRISIARVFLKDPPILILDEATSALDNESERLVQQSLTHLAEGRTVITIAHRLTTIQGADNIVVLTEDGVAEQGRHEELLARGGVYADLHHFAGST
ncbi:MAG: ABC transporter ATP-binding protein [Clostridiaceae bacterium]|nr:ABC transporter ATP-binding protein [Clostridiaceae bacterium]